MQVLDAHSKHVQDQHYILKDPEAFFIHTLHVNTQCATLVNQYDSHIKHANLIKHHTCITVIQDDAKMGKELLNLVFGPHGLVEWPAAKECYQVIMHTSCIIGRFIFMPETILDAM